MASETVNPKVNDRKEIFGWAMYDWANSAFSTTVGTVFLAPYVASLARAAAEKAGTSTIPFFGIPVAPDSFLPYSSCPFSERSQTIPTAANK
jgi:UMF1 family MFS transporter